MEELFRASEKCKIREQVLRKDKPHREFPPYNNVGAFRCPIPGYTGFRPLVRSKVEGNGTKAEMCSTSTKVTCNCPGTHTEKSR